jgi:hypothetical protein
MLVGVIFMQSDMCVESVSDIKPASNVDKILHLISEWSTSRLLLLVDSFESWCFPDEKID